ncbi:MAG: hypothetical protein L6U99_07480 [Clostridium sp.]|nr:MAG: hypothetical protein L6U99_07480 [Clostridium sp.]
MLGCNLARDFFIVSKKAVTLLARGKWAEEIKKIMDYELKNQLFPHTSVTRIPVITKLKSK